MRRGHRPSAVLVAALLALALPVVAASPAGAAPSDDDWLGWVNLYRAQAALPALTENAAASTDATTHSQWMVSNNTVSHPEYRRTDNSNPPNNECLQSFTTVPASCTPLAPGATVAGHRAGSNGNIAGFTNEVTNRRFVESWITGPFHVVATLDPTLTSTGFGRASDSTALAGEVESAATFDVLRGIAAPVPAAVNAPRGWPGHGSVTSLTSYPGFEAPNPLTPCAGYVAPTGAPITVRFGAFRDLTVTSASFSSVDEEGDPIATLDSCAYSTNYTNPNGDLQSLGRHILNVHASAVLIPRQPLVVGTRYRYDVSVNVAGIGAQRLVSTFTVGTLGQAAAPTYSTLPVIVRDSSLDPVPGTQVEVCTPDGSYCTTATTGANGQVLLPQMPVGPVVVRVDDTAGGPPRVQNVTVVAGSNPSVGVTLPEAPGAPTIVTVTAGGSSVLVTWAPPTTDGGDAVTHYDVQTVGGTSIEVVAPATSVRVLGLTPGTPRQFLVRAANDVGDGPFSATSAAVTPGWTDVAGNPFLADITWMGDSGITTGFADRTFRPTGTVQRMAMAAFLYRAAGSPTFTPGSTCTFTDVPITHQFRKEICWLADSGITTGFADNTFRPGGAVQRMSMAAFLYRFAGSIDGADPQCTAQDFADVPTTHPFCGEIAWMSSEEITTGSPNPGGGLALFKPSAAIVRMAMAAFLHRYHEQVEPLPRIG